MCIIVASVCGVVSAILPEAEPEPRDNAFAEAFNSVLRWECYSQHYFIDERARRGSRSQSPTYRNSSSQAEVR